MVMLIKAAAPEVWEQGEGFIGMCEHIARCSSICYNSTPKRGGEAVDFVSMLIKKGHGRALEFGTVYKEEEEVPKGRTWSKSNCVDGRILTTYNLRELIERRGYDLKAVEKEAETRPGYNYKRRVTFHYPALSRAIADEFRTHTELSTMMRSTRYVSAEGEGGLAVVEPDWYGTATPQKQSHFMRAMEAAQDHYSMLLEMGLKRQEARDVLPLAVATEMVQCGFGEAWDNFLQLRCSKAAHPDARALAFRVNRGLVDYSVRLLNEVCDADGGE